MVMLTLMIRIHFGSSFFNFKWDSDLTRDEKTGGGSGGKTPRGCRAERDTKWSTTGGRLTGRVATSAILLVDHFCPSI